MWCDRYKLSSWTWYTWYTSGQELMINTPLFLWHLHTWSGIILSMTTVNLPILFLRALTPYLYITHIISKYQSVILAVIKNNAIKIAPSCAHPGVPFGMTNVNINRWNAAVHFMGNIYGQFSRSPIKNVPQHFDLFGHNIWHICGCNTWHVWL